MIPAAFTYRRAGSLTDALNTLNGGDAQALAGGHSLIPTMKLRLNQPETIVDIARLEELKGIEKTDDRLVIGAAVTHAEIAQSDLVRKHAAWIADAAEGIGDIAVRNRGTIGGACAHADPAADWPGVLIAAGAELELASATGTRRMRAGDFFTGFFETGLEEGELITSVSIPVLGKDQRATYIKFPQPASRYAIVGAAVVLTTDGSTINDAVVAVTGLTDHAFRLNGVEDALRGQELSKVSAATAAGRVGSPGGVLSDHFASEEYRLHLAGVYIRRALEACL